MKVVIKADSFVHVGIMPLGSKHKILRKLGITVERTDAVHDRTKIDIKGFPANNNFLPLENRASAREVLVDDPIKLTRILVGQA